STPSQSAADLCGQITPAATGREGARRLGQGHPAMWCHDADDRVVHLAGPGASRTPVKTPVPGTGSGCGEDQGAAISSSRIVSPPRSQPPPVIQVVPLSGSAMISAQCSSRSTSIRPESSKCNGSLEK